MSNSLVNEPDYSAIPVYPAELEEHLRRRSDRLSIGALRPAMKSLRDLSLWPLWVNPEHRVKTALILMRGHGVPCLGVMSNNSFIGAVFVEDLIGVPEETPIEKVMRQDILTVSPDSSLRDVARLMSEAHSGAIAILEQDEFKGMVVPRDLIADLGVNFDPLTGLPWSDVLREWGVQRLGQGQEVTIIFFDLNDFGLFNKAHGHIVGDRVLQSVANTLRLSIDDEKDILCRYGGDEFAIGTLRDMEEAEHFAEWLLSRINKVELGEGIQVSATFGVFGGRRSRERPDQHPGATLDNLINMASKRALAKKETQILEEPVEAPKPTQQPSTEKVLVELVSAAAANITNGCRAVVVLKVEDKLLTGVASSQSSQVEAAANATIQALAEGKFCPSDVRIEQALVAENENAAIVTVVIDLPTGVRAASLEGKDNLATLTAQAVINALFN